MKTWHLAIAIGLVLLCLLASLYFIESRSEEKLTKAHDDVVRLESKFSTMQAQLDRRNSEIVQANAEITRLNEELRRKDTVIAKQRRDAQAKAQQEAAAVAALQPSEVALRTSAILGVQAGEVKETPAGGLEMSQAAARSNLSALIIGDSATKELKLQDQRIDLLEQEIANLQKINSQLEELVQNKDKQIAGMKEVEAAKEKEFEAALKVEKAKGRRRGLVGAMVGFIGGILTHLLL